MAIPFRQEYRAELANKGGWLAFFFALSLLSVLAYFRMAMAAVISGAGQGLIALVVALVMLVAWIGLLRGKRWAYYLFLAVGGFLLAWMTIDMIAAPDMLFHRDWAFDIAIAFEWLIAAGWIVYLLSSRRVYSYVFGA
jgi:hypothetical protein